MDSEFKKVKPGFCKLCGNRIILVPTAKERAEKNGGNASDYTRIFTTHPDCLLKYRDGK